jgi:hypothetical protein
VLVQKSSPFDNVHQSCYLEIDGEDAVWHIEWVVMQYGIGSVRKRGDDGWAAVAAVIEGDMWDQVEVSQRHFVVVALGIAEHAGYNSHDQKVEPTRAAILLAAGSSEVGVEEESPSTENRSILAAKELMSAHTRL